MLLSAINSDFGQRPLSYPLFGEESVSSPMQRYPYNYSGELTEQKMVHPSTGVSSSFFQMRPDISFAQVDPLVSPSLGLGAGGQDPSRMAMHIQQLMCKVCGDTASGNHFGVLSCEACKSFFRRSVRSGTQYACRGSRDCNIQKTTRNRCQYCRLQKCMAVGMRKEAVQEERKPVTGRDEPLTPTKANASSTTLHSPPGSSQHSPTLAPRHRYHSSLPNIPYNTADQMALGEPQTEQCSRRSEVGYDPALTLESLVQAEKDIVEPSPGEPTAGVTVSTNEVFHAAKESLIRIIEWSKRVPVFASLPIADQVKLLKATWAEVMMLRLSVRTAHAFQEGKPGVVLATGRTITPDNTDDPQLAYVFTRVKEELAKWFVAQSIDSTEITLLQAVILFNPDSRGISAAGKDKVHQIQKQLLQMMEKYLCSKLPTDKLRFPLLLLRLTTIKAISIDVVQHMEMHRTLGDTHLDRILIELLDSDS